MFERSRIALVLGVIVLVMAIILRVRWQYNPPPVDEDIYWIDVVQQSLVESLEPEELSATTTTTTTQTTAISAAAITVTPEASARQVYEPGNAAQLVTGVQPTVVANATGFTVGFLFGERYVAKGYTTEWQPLDGDVTLADGLKLIGGQLPFTLFSHTGTEFVLIYAIVNDRGSVDLKEKRWADLANVLSESTLLTDLPLTTTIQASVTSHGTAVLLRQAAAVSSLVTFTPQGVRLADVELNQTVDAQAVIGDADSWLVFGQTTDGLYVEKLSDLGIASQTVTVALPELATTTQTQLLDVTRSGDYLALTTNQGVLVLADNLSSVQGDFALSSNQLHPQVTISQDKLYLTYDTPVTLTEYQIHTLTLPLASAEPAT